jgi:hypothetical protein
MGLTQLLPFLGSSPRLTFDYAQDKLGKEAWEKAGEQGEVMSRASATIASLLQHSQYRREGDPLIRPKVGLAGSPAKAKPPRFQGWLLLLLRSERIG